MNLFLEKYENYKSTVNKRLANIIEETFVDSEVINVMKYSLNIEMGESGDPMEVILNDKCLMIMGLFYILVLFGILYV